MGNKRTNDVIRTFVVILSLASLSQIVQNPGSLAIKPQQEQHQQKSSYGNHNTCPPQQANYTVSFLSPQQQPQGWGGLYSGMWWQSIDTMLQTNFSRDGHLHLEAVSSFAFRDASKVLQTVDWLDLAVEHLSKYVKHFQEAWSSSESSDDAGIAMAMQLRVEEILLQYIETAKQSCHHQYDASTLKQSSDTTAQSSAILSTIAILPIRMSSEDVGTATARLSMLQLAATIASLWNVGMPRVIVAGVADNEKVVAQQAFDLLKGHLETRPMALESGLCTRQVLHSGG